MRCVAKGLRTQLDTVRFDGSLGHAAPLLLAYLPSLAPPHLVYTNVGYGSAEQVVVPKVGPTFPFDGIRKWTTSGF
jgi:hypothetical protein